MKTCRRSFLALPFLAGSAANADPPPFYRDKSRLLVWLDPRGKEQAVKWPSHWERRREHILASFQLVAGALPPAYQRVPLEVKVEETVSDDHAYRHKVTYAAEPGDRVPAYVFVPKHARRRAPAMLCLHQTTRIGKAEPAGIGGLKNLHYARELAELGYVTIAPDYPGYGDYAPPAAGARSERPYELGYLSATMKGIWNHRRAVDFLQAMPEVNDERIGVIGHSLGGHNAIFAALFDERLRVVVTSCGFNSFAKYAGGDLRGWSHPGYMPRIASHYSSDPKRMPFDFTELIAALAPRAVFINAPLRDSNFEVSGVQDCVRAAQPVFELLKAKDQLIVAHPNCGHDFPPEIREQVYRFIDQQFSHGNPRVLQKGYLSRAQALTVASADR